VLTIWVYNFWQNDFGAKAAHKMLVKLTPGGSKDPKYVCNFYIKKYKIDNNSAATEASKKISTELESLKKEQKDFF
jgi:hypothetical protein